MTLGGINAPTVSAGASVSSEFVLLSHFQGGEKKKKTKLEMTGAMAPGTTG